MLTENKFSKYFLYAIGEIVLVVIGILIALQINNWNEQSKIRKSADTQLNQLSQNISDDLIQLDALNEVIETYIIKNQTLSDQFQQIIPFDSLTTSFITTSLFEQNFYANTTAYDKLNMTGEFTVLPKALQMDITAYYNLLNRIKEREEITNTFIKKEIEPYYFNNYSKYHRKGSNKHPLLEEYYKNDKREAIPLDTSAIMDDDKMATLNFARLYQIKIQQEFYEEALQKGIKLKVSIDEYLN
ncbi:DUF6090 family protein [Winogradskyella pulchriflava]|uniref:DUF6090 family protein n=2 Tax=Flavobacteriaceae TaxID=49546 RepID=A0ABV6QF23_9FLAO|nr:hypothetical protein BFP75_00555 [Maribacter sp. 4G9]